MPRTRKIQQDPMNSPHVTAERMIEIGRCLPELAAADRSVNRSIAVITLSRSRSKNVGSRSRAGGTATAAPLVSPLRGWRTACDTCQGT